MASMPVATHVLLLTLAAPAAIRWAPSLEDALARAEREKRVVFVAINMDGERANREMVRDHYRDATLAKLGAHTVNVFCSLSGEPKLPGVTAAVQNRCERQVRARILQVDGEAPIVAPQHLFLAPDGKILAAVPYYLTKGELEWL